MEAVDYVKGGIDLELEYAVLAGLCAEMLDGIVWGFTYPEKEASFPTMVLCYQSYTGLHSLDITVSLKIAAG